ncbi:hypothetical protein EAG14_20500 [Acidovorax sp. 1608163]|nr:hypothetical protein EAG14_20500 [Acidovorax sp. 1608163]
MSRIIPSTPSASALHGLWFVFQHAGHRFALWTSSLTGKEEVYLNGVLVAVRRKIALTSVHELAVGEATYSLELTTRNLRRGVFECVLRQDGVAVAVLETEYVARNRWLQSAVVIGGTALLVFGARKSGASFGWVAVGMMALATLSHSYLGRGSGYVIRPATVSGGEV